MQTILDEWAQRFGLSYGVQMTAEVAQRLTAEGDAFAGSSLTATEYTHFEKYRLPKRRIEWLAGRIAAKAAFAHYQKNGCDWHSVLPISVLNGPNRAPYIAEYPSVGISLTHSHDYAIAVIAGFAVGIDLEKVESRPPALAEFFFSPEERRMLEESCPHPAQQHAFMTKIWSRKEAVVKLLSVGGTMDFKLINTVLDRVSVHCTTLEGLHLVSASWGGYALSLALATSPSSTCGCA